MEIQIVTSQDDEWSKIIYEYLEMSTEIGISVGGLFNRNIDGCPGVIIGKEDRYSFIYGSSGNPILFVVGSIKMDPNEIFLSQFLDSLHVEVNRTGEDGDGR